MTDTTTDEMTEFARAHFAVNPDATCVDAAKAFRAAGGNPNPIYTFAKVCEQIAPIPTLDTAEAATAFLADMVSRGYEWVAVFWDKGWGDRGQAAEITVIQDGDGQIPLARVTPDVYRELLASGVIARNSLQTYKARKLHEYVPAAVTS